MILFHRSFKTICLLFLVLFCACSKKEDQGGNGSYYMRFKINGTQFEFKEQVEGHFSKKTSLQYNSSLAGVKEEFIITKNNMSLLLTTDGETQTGITYTNHTTTTAGFQKAKLANLVYLDENGKSHQSWMEEFASALPVGTEINAQIKITEVTGNSIKGFFSGVLYNEGLTTKMTITDGEFLAKRKN